MELHSETLFDCIRLWAHRINDMKQRIYAIAVNINIPYVIRMLMKMLPSLVPQPSHVSCTPHQQLHNDSSHILHSRSMILFCLEENRTIQEFEIIRFRNKSTFNLLLCDLVVREIGRASCRERV